MLTFKDLNVAFESLLKAKAYVFTIVITLGITLGAVVAMFDLSYQLLAQPLPYEDANHLVIFKGDRFEKAELLRDRTYPYPILIDIYKRQDSDFVQKAIVDYTVSIERDWPDSPVLTTANVTPEFFSIFNVPLVLGRSFSKEEGLDAMQPVAVISVSAWQKYFAQTPDVLGKTLNIMGTHFKIIGVMGEGFIEPELDNIGNSTDVFLPFDFNDIAPGARAAWSLSMNNSFIVGQLKPGASPEVVAHAYSSQAAAKFKDEVAAIAGLENASLRLRILPLVDIIRGDSAHQSLLMFAGVLVLLLIASTNISNLLMARAANQQRNLAIEVALGAQRIHIFNRVFSEILLLTCGAGLVALAVALVIFQIVKQVFRGQLPRLQELALNGGSLLFAMAASVALAIVFALIVTRQIKYGALNNALQTSGKGTGLQISARMRSFLILSQVALTGVILAASLQVLWQSLKELNQPLGYNTQNQYQVRFSVATLMANTSIEQRRDLEFALQDSLRINPKIQSVGLSSGSPISNFKPYIQFVAAEEGDQQRISAASSFSDETYLQILNIPLVAGRYFTNADARICARVVLVNETLAHRLQADGNVLNKIIRRVVDSTPEGIRIVGVVKDLNLPGIIEPPRFFQPLITETPEFLIAMKPGQSITPIELNKIAAEISPQLKVAFFHTTDEAIAHLTAHQKSAAGLTATLAIFALCLTAIGIYGVLSYSVQLRRFELGIRMAIGAPPAMIFMQTLKDNLAPVIIGLISALVLLVPAYWWVQQTSYNLPTNAMGWLLPSLLILVVTAVTSLLSVWQIIRKPASFSLKGN